MASGDGEASTPAARDLLEFRLEEVDPLLRRGREIARLPGPILGRIRPSLGDLRAFHGLIDLTRRRGQLLLHRAEVPSPGHERLGGFRERLGLSQLHSELPDLGLQR